MIFHRLLDSAGDSYKSQRLNAVDVAASREICSPEERDNDHRPADRRKQNPGGNARLGSGRHTVLPINDMRSEFVFGSGNFAMLQEMVQARRSGLGISGVFVGANTLLTTQMNAFREAFELPVYDRYRIVLEIFRAHAKTKEAKLQVALAELPYLRTIFGGDGDGVPSSSIQPHSPSTSGQTYRGLKKNLIQASKSI